jgi:hypothetical protein
MINGGNKIIKHLIKTEFMQQYNGMSPAVALELGYLNSFQEEQMV